MTNLECDHDIDQGNAIYLRPVVSYISNRYGVRRIAYLRGSREEVADVDLSSDSTAGGTYRDDVIAPSVSSLNSNEHNPQHSDATKPAESHVDLVVINDINDLQQRGPELIATAGRRLYPNGILLIALPIRHPLGTAVISAASWLARRNTHSMSQVQLRDLLTSHEFTVLESIRINNPRTLVLVAQKTGNSLIASASPRSK